MTSLPGVPTLPSWPYAEARAWSRASAPRLLPFAVLVGAVVGGVFGVVGEGDAPCSPQDPTVCGPEVGFSLAIVLLVGSVALQWTRPLLGCALGIAFSLLDIRYDTPIGARGFTGYLVLCLAVAGWVVVCRQRQRNLAEAIGGGARLSPSGPPVAPGRWGWADLFALFPIDIRAMRVLAGFQPARILIGSALLVGAVGCGVVYHQSVAAEQVHVARSIRVDARVSDGPEDAQTFTPVVNVPGGPRSVELTPLEWYPAGSIQPVLLDPEDSDWARLVAEPDDQTLWLTVGGGALLLALTLGANELSVRRHRVLLSSGTHPALAVRIVQVPDGEVLVLAANRDVVVATYRSSPVDPPDGQASTPPEIREAVLYGDLRQGGWAAAQSAHGLVLPESPLRPERRPFPYSSALFADPDDELDVDPETVGIEVVEGRQPTAGDIPLREPNPLWRRVIGGIGMVVLPVVGPYVAWRWTEGLGEAWGVLVLGGTMLGTAVGWFAPGFALEEDRVVTDSGYFRHELPLALVEAIRVDGDTVFVVAQDEAISFEPFPEVTPRSARQDRVLEIAAQLRFLVDRAHTTPGPDPRSRRRPSAGLAAAVVFVGGVLVAAVLRHVA